jgi:N-acetylmuramoyl-L-alanine amidase
VNKSIVLVFMAAAIFFSPFAFALGQTKSAQASSNASGTASGGISVVYPKPDVPIDSPSTYILGACPQGSVLKCNGAPVKLNAMGYFAHVVKLKPGKNNFNLTIDATGGNAAGSVSITVLRPEAAKPLPAYPLKLVAQSIVPNEDMGLGSGDILELAVRATPKAQVTVSIGRRQVALKPLAKVGNNVIHGLDAAYGQSIQPLSANAPDVYCGFYRITANDHWSKVCPLFTVSKGTHKLSLKAQAKISVVEQPLSAATASDGTVVRLGPGQARTTPLAAGVRLLVDGYQGDSMRCLLAPGHHVWISKQDLVFNREWGVAPSSVVRTVNLENGVNGEARVVIPLSQRLPYQVQQKINPNSLSLQIFGVTSDTDWVTPAPSPATKQLIDNVTWNQVSDKIYQLKVNLSEPRQWGYDITYEGTNLVLHIKAPPHFVSGGKMLAGSIICLDPGHGGSETGAIGPSGVHESQVNLAIAGKLKDILEARGATVIMTRQSDSQTLSLQERVDIAVKSHCDLLVSIHNNALPDGRDPWAEHGTSSYWYQPQAMELARILKNSLCAKLGFPDFGVFYDNLALTRPCQTVAVLVEVGFMVQPDEYTQLTKPETQDKAALALADGITGYLQMN